MSLPARVKANSKSFPPLCLFIWVGLLASDNLTKKAPHGCTQWVALQQIPDLVNLISSTLSLPCQLF